MSEAILSQSALQEFKKLYFEEFGEEISDEQAVELGTNLLTFFDHIYRPVKKEWSDKLSEKGKNK